MEKDEVTAKKAKIIADKNSRKFKSGLDLS